MENTISQLEREIELRIVKHVKHLLKRFDAGVNIRRIAEQDLKNNVEMKELRAELKGKKEVFEFVSKMFYNHDLIDGVLNLIKREIKGI